jgi:hypothetical protein
MRSEDFLSGKFKDLKFRISYPDELVTTQKEVDQFAVDFVEWCEMKMAFSSSVIHKPTYDKLLLVFKKEKGL